MLDRYYYDIGEYTPAAAPPEAPPAGDAFATVMAGLSPTAWWRLGDSGGTAADEQAVQDGTYTGSPTTGATGMTSDGDDAVTFAAASSQYVSIADNAAWDVGTSDFSVFWGMSLSAWPSSVSGVLIRGNAYGTGDYGVWLQSGLVRLLLAGTAYSLPVTTGNYVNNGFHTFIVAVDRSANAALYVDGSTSPVTTVDVSSSSGSDLTGSRVMGIAADAHTPQWYLSATLDEVAFFNGTLLDGDDAASLHGSL